MQSRRTFTPAFKREICRQLTTGEKRVAQLCREHGIGENLIHRWRAIYRTKGEQAFEPTAPAMPSVEARIAELERFCGQLALENQLLKKALQHVRPRSEPPCS